MGVFIGICLIILIMNIVIFIIYKVRVLKNEKIENNLEIKKDNMIEKENFYPVIKVIERNDLVPSKDNLITNEQAKRTLATIDNLTPKVVSTSKNIKNVQELSKKGKVLFSANEQDVKNMMSAGKNKYYGTQVSSKTKKITEQTKFTKEAALTKNITKQQLTIAGFNMISAVVGQYYMSEINDKLEVISANIDKISNFQDSEYQSKLLHIVSKIEEILEHQDEILKNDETRKNAYHDNKELETKCAELLGQANMQISKEINNSNLDYKNYEIQVKKIEKWFLRQQLTQELLMKIGDLRYVLANGSETSKLAHKQYNNYIKQTNNINQKLESWHNSYINKFGIDINKQRKKGNLYKLREYTIGMINKEWNYDKIKNGIVEKILLQNTPNKFNLYENNKQDEVILIQKYEGEYYNLPLNNNDNNNK